jgi:outer membrane protein assembly factor BamB
MSDGTLGQTQPAAPEPEAATMALARILDQYLADLQAGRAPDRDRLLADYPQLAAELEQCLSGIDFVHRAAQPGDGTPAQLGDFRILREIGRGGMGVVYEAEQVSLHRRVALKVLRFGAVADPEAMQRFQREAETVARLHHTNIVPIFAVGSEQGVHYYAMQFIEGRSLAAVAGEARAGLEPPQLAGLGLQAAEALAHAHQCGVIHRDVKPSNLLLDGDGVVWLTDFGLARRLDQVTLTVTGVLMGTPRYMSPEQAAGAKQPVDQRSDVYSLGATLYELATGRPVFDADTPQGVITQILNAEPIAPRLLKSGLPADLETIVLKCLAKEPARRYQTARALADDLRAFLDGRPIRARRPGLAERAGRWVRKHHRSATLMSVAAAAAVVVMVAGLFAADQYRQWRIGYLFLGNDGPVLTGELLDDSGRAVTPKFTVPTEEPLALPSGPYGLHLRGRGFLDETLQVGVERGEELAFNVGLSDQRLWEPIAVAKTYECLRVGDRHDILALSAAGVTRRHGGTGAELWTAKLGAKDDPKLAGFRWDWDKQGTPSGRNELDRRPRLLQPAPDLDGDGVPDLVWGSRRQAAVLALSGKDGRVLWCFQGPPPKLGPNNPFADERAATGVVLGVAALPDVDGDGIPDLVAAFTSQEQADGSVPRWVEALSGRTGKSLWRHDLDAHWFDPPPGTGVPFDSLWDNSVGTGIGSGSRFSLDMLYEKDWLHVMGGLPAPYPPAVVAVEGRPVVVLAAGTRLVGLDPRTGTPAWPAHDLGFWPLRAPQFADLDGTGTGTVLLLGLGDEVHPVEKGPNAKPGVRVIAPPDARQFLPPNPLAGKFPVNERTDDRLKLVALTLASQKRLWETSFRGYWGWTWFQEPFTWPVVADLDGDGRPEIIVPTGDFEGETKWSGVLVCDGADGKERWHRTLSRSDRSGQVQQVNRFVVGPSRAADGCRPVFTAVPDGDFFPRDRPYSSIHVRNFDKDYMHPVLLLDALSGKDGHSLWWARQRLPNASLTTSPKPSVGPLQWWHAAADGWPQLVVPYVPGTPQVERQRYPVYFVSSHTGKVVHLGIDYQEVRTLDLDGDGTPDLLSFRLDQPDAYDHGGRLEAIRGHSPEAWRRLGGPWQPAGDLDGDGIPDLVTTQPPDQPGHAGPGEVVREEAPTDPETAARRERGKRERLQSKAISGRDGHVLWRQEIVDEQRRAPWEETRFTNLHPLPAGVDLDGDGVPDLLVTGKSNCSYMREGAFSPLLTVSGRTGRRLWAADIAVELWNGPQLLQCRDLDGDGQPEILFVSASDWGRERQANGSRSTDDWQYWLAVLSARDGKVRWKQPLGERDHPGRSPATVPFACVLADLDGDGVLDIVIEGGVPGKDGTVHAFSGKDGTPLWRWAPEPRLVDWGANRASRPTLAVGDLDGDGRPEVIVLHNVTVAGAKPQAQLQAEVLALDGTTGRPKWTWREPVDPQYNDTTNGAVRSRVTPLLVTLDGGKRRAVCVWTYHPSSGGQIVLLDATGKELQRQRVPFRLNGEDRKRSRQQPQYTYSPLYGSLFRVWAVDLDGDGTDELVYFSADRLRVLRGGLDRVLYEWPLPDEDCDLLEVSPRTPQHPPLLVVRAGSRVVFLGTAPDKPYATCTGSGTPLAVAWGPSGPRIIYELGNQVTVCRVAEAAADGEPVGPQPSPVPPGDDPRFVVALPWVPFGGLPPLLPSSPLGLAAALLGICVAVLVVPVAVVVWAVRRRAWLLCLLPVLWLAVLWGGAYLLFLARLEDEAKFEIYQWGPWGFAWRVGLGLVLLAVSGLPIAAFLGVAAAWLRRRRWGRLGLLLTAAAGLAVLVGWAWLASPVATLSPEQHYSWRGWYAMWPAGVYAAGALTLGGFLLLRAVHLGRAGLRRFLRGRAA